jgi:DNA-directed RNA polymerase I subunit RPA49
MVCDRPKVTTDMETRLLTHMFALCLRLDNFSVETELLAGDLSMPQKK